MNKTGVTVNKAELKLNLVTQTIESSKKLQAFATFENDPVLLRETKISLSKLKNKSANEIVDYAQLVIERAETYKMDIISLGFKDEDLVVLAKALADFKAAIPKRRISEIESGQNSTKMEAGYARADKALENIDILVEILKLPNPEFYKGYRASRRIIVKGSGTLSTRYHVVDAVTGQSISGVSILVTPADSGAVRTNKSNVVLEKVSGEKGWANDKSLTAGMYKVTVKKIGYVEKEVSFAVTDGEMNLLVIELNKNA